MGLACAIDGQFKPPVPRTHQREAGPMICSLSCILVLKHKTMCCSKPLHPKDWDFPGWSCRHCRLQSPGVNKVLGCTPRGAPRQVRPGLTSVSATGRDS